MVAILDADKQGFLRSATSLIQTIGRAARNVSGFVLMYADDITPAMASAIEETDRRRAKQTAYNTARGIDPAPLRKKIADVTDMLIREDIDTEILFDSGYRGKGPDRKHTPTERPPRQGAPGAALGDGPAAQLAALIQDLSDQMHAAAEELKFELAARLRDEISDLKKELRQLRNATM
jgi:excinuclease ABC subunit B